MPSSRALRRTLTASLLPLLCANTPPSLEHPNPISETCSPVFPKLLYRNVLPRFQVVGEPVCRAGGDRHRGERRILLAAGRETACIADNDIRDLMEPVPCVEHSVLWRAVHADGPAVVHRPSGDQLRFVAADGGAVTGLFHE